MSYIDESLSSEERIEGLFRLHWIAWVPMCLWLLLGLVTFGLTWFVALYEFLRLRSTEQGATNKRVILKRGIVSRRTEEMRVTSIETVEIDQGVWGRIFGFGTIKVTGRGLSDVVFKYLDDPMSAKRRIEGVSHSAS